MKDFQLGDKVKCLSKPNWCDHLTIDKIYNVKLVSENHIVVDCGINTSFHNKRFELIERASKDNEGFTLIEVLVTLVIFSILSIAFLGLFRQANLKIVQLTKLINTPSVKTNNTRLVPIASKCIQLDGQYYGYSTDGDTLNIFTDNACKQALGTLGRLGNESWVNIETNSSWLLFNNAGLKLLVVKY